MAIRGLPLGQAIGIAVIVLAVGLTNYIYGWIAPDEDMTTVILAVVTAGGLMGIYALLGAFKHKEDVA